MKKILLYISFVFAGLHSFAQAPEVADDKPNEIKEKRIEALYIAYITKQLDLTPEEAQKFWPVHAQYLNEMKAIHTENNVLDRDQKILNIKKKYQTNFSKVLGAERCNKFYGKEGEFRKKMIERLKQMRQQRMRERPINGKRGGLNGL